MSRLKDEVNFLVRKFWKLFYFPSNLIFVTESFQNIFFYGGGGGRGVSDLRICFKSLQIKYRISLYIILWLTVERRSFASNLKDEIKPG